MNQLPSRAVLTRTLQEAWDAHREYQKTYLHGEHDEVWAGWYAGFVIGRLGEFVLPSRLTVLLEETAELKPWTENAAAHILEALG